MNANNEYTNTGDNSNLIDSKGQDAILSENAENVGNAGNAADNDDISKKYTKVQMLETDSMTIWVRPWFASDKDEE